jgi:hypothetical protein
MIDQSFTLDRGPRNLTRLIAFLSSLDVTKAWLITIGPAKKERTTQQNKALWGCAYEYIRKATGNDKDDLHEMFCGEYFGWEVREVMGLKKKYPKRTTTTGYDGKRDVISTVQLQDFYAFVQQRAAEYSVYVPDPDPMWWSYKNAA